MSKAFNKGMLKGGRKPPAIPEPKPQAIVVEERPGSRAYDSGKMISGSYVELPDVPSSTAGPQIILSPIGTDKTEWANADILAGPPGPPGPPGGVVTMIVQPDRPDPALWGEGQEWLRTTDMTKFTLYVDANSRDWIRELNGKSGQDGADGADGATGATGPQGPVGPEGPAGVAEPHALDVHTDVSTEAAVDGQRLTWDGSIDNGDGTFGEWAPKFSTSGIGIIQFSYRWAIDTAVPNGGQMSRQPHPLPAPIVVGDPYTLYLNKVGDGGEDLSLFFGEIQAGQWMNVHDKADTGNGESYDVTGPAVLVGDVYEVPVTVFEVTGVPFSGNERVSLFWKIRAEDASVAPTDIYQEARPDPTLYEEGQGWVRTSDHVKFQLYIDVDSRDWIAIGGAGAQGAKGDTGAAGLDGTDGVDGADGLAGPAGPEGPVGPTSIGIGSNVVINGDFRVNQRDFAGDWDAISDNEFGFDRWMKSGSSILQNIEPEEIIPGAQYVLSWKGGGECATSLLLGGTAVAGQLSPVLLTAGTTGNTFVSFIHNSFSGVNKPYDIKLELGSVFTPFEPRPFSAELALCHWYFERIKWYSGPAYVANGHMIDATNGYVILPWQAKRQRNGGSPLISFSGVFKVAGQGTLTTCTLTDSNSGCLNNGRLVVTTTGQVANAPIMVTIADSATYIDVDAEIT